MGLVFYVTLAVAVAFVVWGVGFTGNLQSVAGTLMGYFVRDLGWLYLILATSFLVFVVYLVFSSMAGSGSARRGTSPSSAVSRGSRCSSRPGWA